MKFWSLLLILRISSYTATAEQSPLMQSLDCFNDYTTFINCTWSECEDARQFLKMNLFYKDNKNSKILAPMSCSSQEAGSYRSWTCSEKRSYFSPLLENTYVFKPDKKLEAQLNVSLNNNVQPPPPQKLRVTPIQGGHFQLEWEAGDGSNGSHFLDEALDFEVSYKRIWEHWEKSSSILVSNTSRYLLRQDTLMLGSNYSARIRSVLRQDSGISGHPSEWSTEIHWNTQEGDEAQPKNLRCLFNGIDRLNCSWEVRREVTSSVLFSLFYQASPGSEEKECSPVQTMELSPNVHIPHVLQSCEITVTDRQNQYHVVVRPKEETKVMNAAQSIKPHRPFNLSIEKMEKQAYMLRWKTYTIKDYSERYEISYWKTSEPSENKIKDVRDSAYLIFTLEDLETATRYKAKVRAKLNRSGYNGPWSEWSKEYEWETESSLPPWSLLLVAPTVTILIAVGLCSGPKYLLNKKNKWEAKIPSPPRKFLLPDYFPKIHNSSLDFSSQRTVVEDRISYTTVLEKPLFVTSSESLGAESGTEESLSGYHNMEILKQFPLSTENFGQCLNQAGPSATRDCICRAEGSLVQVFDFDGPYLQCPLESSVLDIQQNMNSASLEIREPSASLQYMELPQTLWLHQVPVGRKNETAPLLSIVHDLSKHALSKEQEASQGHSTSSKPEQEESGQKQKSPTSAKNPCQNGSLDYIATADLPLAKERDTSLLSPLESLKPEESTCDHMETSVSQSSQTIESLSSPELCPKGQAQPVPSRTFQEAFGDYVLTLPRTPGSASKEGLSFSPGEPQCDKGFFLFKPDAGNPVFLHQVGDYCFLPGTKLTKDSKSPGRFVGHSFSGTNQMVTKPHKKCDFVGGKLQPSPHIPIDTYVPVSQQKPQVHEHCLTSVTSLH